MKSRPQWDDYDYDLWRDIIGLILPSKQLGSGASRQVYEYNDDTVIKIEGGDGYWHLGSSDNVSEYRAWRLLADSKWEGYFAPAIKLSPGGKALLMRRTSPISLEDMMSLTHIPSLWTDRHLLNYGRLAEGNIVAHDYGGIDYELNQSGLRGARMLKNRESFWR